MSPYRRGACPSLSDPMPTGDGLLVRLTPAEPLDLDTFAAIYSAALEQGNGSIEVTQRGSLQIRGLTPFSAPLLASAVGTLGIAAADRVVTDPLHGDPAAVIDTADLGAQLRRAVADARLELAPKISVVVDGGGRLHLDAMSADVRLRAIETPEGPVFLVTIGGDGRSAALLGSIAPEAAVDCVIELLRVIADRGQAARAADIPATAFHEAVSAAPALRPPPRPPAEPIGQHPLRDGVALGIALAFGHARAGDLIGLARAASSLGVRSIRPVAGRALLLHGAAPSKIVALANAAQQLDFIVHPDDPRRRVAACSGKPACASGLIATRAIAADIARLGPLPGGMVHVSGCPKGCAHPAPAALTLVGTERGCGVIHDGTARSHPACIVDPARVVDEVLADRAREAAHG